MRSSLLHGSMCFTCNVYYHWGVPNILEAVVLSAIKNIPGWQHWQAYSIPSFVSSFLQHFPPSVIAYAFDKHYYKLNIIVTCWAVLSVMKDSKLINLKTSIEKKV